MSMHGSTPYVVYQDGSAYAYLSGSSNFQGSDY
jgi:hypothetical protein